VVPFKLIKVNALNRQNLSQQACRAHLFIYRCVRDNNSEKYYAPSRVTQSKSCCAQLAADGTEPIVGSDYQTFARVARL
jgi:hypothetical protein